MCKGVLSLLIAALFISLPLYAGQLLVPEEYSFIQDAVDMAGPGDTISVGPGIYPEHIAIVGKVGITLLSRNRQEAVILGLLPKGDRPDGGGILIMDSDSITIDGFVFLLCGYFGFRDPGILPGAVGGAINVLGLMPPAKNFIESCHVEITNNVFLLNFGLAGGAINVYGGAGDIYKFDGPAVPVVVEIEENIFALNFAGFDKGGQTPGDKVFLPDGFPYGMGGAVCIWTDEWLDRPEYYFSCEAYIRNNIFRANFAEITGAAIAEVWWPFGYLGKYDRQFPIFSDIYNNTMVDNVAMYGVAKEDLPLPDIGPDLFEDVTKIIGEGMMSYVEEVFSNMHLSDVSIRPFVSDTDNKTGYIAEEGINNTVPKDPEFAPACVYMIASDTWLWNNIIAGNYAIGVVWDFPFLKTKGDDKQDGITGNLDYSATREYPFSREKGGDKQDILLLGSNLFGNYYGPLWDPWGMIDTFYVNLFDNPLLHLYRVQLTWDSPCIDAGWIVDYKNGEGYDWDGTWLDQGAYGGPDPLTIVTWLPLHLGWNLTSVPAVLIPPYDDPESDYTFGDDFPGEAVSIYGFDEPPQAYFPPSNVGFPAGYPAGGYMLGNYTEEYADVMGVPPILPHETFVFRLHPHPYYSGWNLIGNPYPYWSLSTTPTKVMFGDSVLHFDSLGLNNVNYVAKWFNGFQYIFYPEGGWDGWIFPMMGFWVQVSTPGIGSVTFPPHMYIPWWVGLPKDSPVIAGDGMSGDQNSWDWRLRLSVRSGDLVDEYNYVGVSDDSRAASIVEFIPPLDEYVMLYIPQDDVGFQQLKLDDFEGEKNIPVEVVLNTNNDEAELSWEFEGDVSGYEFTLKDESGETFDLAESSRYSFLNTSKRSDVSIQTALTDPALYLDRQIPGEVRRFDLSVKGQCTGIEDVKFTGIEAIAPNPFTLSTEIRFSIASAAEVNLSIYDASGRLVRTLVDERLGVGHHSYRWEGSDEAGVRLPSGIYFYKMSADGYEKIGKLVLVR